MAHRDEVTPSTTTRRDFLKKSAAAGAVLWAAPTITSVPANAQTGSPTPCGGPDVCRTDVDPVNGPCDSGSTLCNQWDVDGECRCAERLVIDREQCDLQGGTFVDCGTFSICVVSC